MVEAAADILHTPQCVRVSMSLFHVEGGYKRPTSLRCCGNGMWWCILKCWASGRESNRLPSQEIGYLLIAQTCLRNFIRGRGMLRVQVVMVWLVPVLWENLSSDEKCIQQAVNLSVCFFRVMNYLQIRFRLAEKPKRKRGDFLHIHPIPSLPATLTEYVFC